MASICVHRATRTPLDIAPGHISSRDDLLEDRRTARTAVSALFHAFPQIIWHGNRHSRGLQGTFARAMASICVHRAPRTPLDSTPGHIRSRVGLQEEPQPATHSRQCPIPRFPAIHLARQSPF